MSFYQDLKVESKNYISSESFLRALHGTMDFFHVNSNRDDCAEGLLKILVNDCSLKKQDNYNKALLITFNELRNRLRELK